MNKIHQLLTLDEVIEKLQQIRKSEVPHIVTNITEIKLETPKEEFLIPDNLVYESEGRYRDKFTHKLVLQSEIIPKSIGKKMVYFG
jgi:hypothetical protein